MSSYRDETDALISKTADMLTVQSGVKTGNPTLSDSRPSMMTATYTMMHPTIVMLFRLGLDNLINLSRIERKEITS